jgi:hypothetical protein
MKLSLGPGAELRPIRSAVYAFCRRADAGASGSKLPRNRRAALAAIIFSDLPAELRNLAWNEVRYELGLELPTTPAVKVRPRVEASGRVAMRLVATQGGSR